MRSHSVSAEGGTAAVLFSDEGDNIESHIYDTIRGSDFLCDQDVADKHAHEIPNEIYQLDKWGMPWSRRDDAGLIRGSSEDILSQGQHMHRIKSDSMKCRHYMIRV